MYLLVNLYVFVSQSLCIFCQSFCIYLSIFLYLLVNLYVFVSQFFGIC